MVRLTDRPDMTLDVYRGRKTTIQQSVYFCLTHDVFKNQPISLLEQAAEEVQHLLSQ